jgi:hypothetical protein
MSITKDERKSLDKSKLFPNDKVIGGVARVYLSKNGYWDFTNIFGVICSYQKDYSLFIGLYNAEKPHDKVFEHECLKFFF